MRNTLNTTDLPFGMSHNTNADHLEAAAFLCRQYPGIYKLRIKNWRHFDRLGAQIKLISSGTPARSITAKGYTLANAVGNLINKIKLDSDLTAKLRHPEKLA